MKIAHLNYFPQGIDKGIYNKFITKSEEAIKNKLEIDFFVLSNFNEEVNSNLKIVKIKYTKEYHLKFFRFSVIERNFNFDAFEFVILRYPSTKDFSSRRFIKKYGHKIISEHHTNEIAEYKLAGNSILNHFKVYLEKFNSSYYLSKVNAIVGVTDEIVKLEQSKTNRLKPSFVFSNGTRFNKSYQKRTEDEFSIIFCCGIFTAWSGLDRLLRSVEKSNLTKKLNIILIGKILKEENDKIASLPKNKNITIQTLGPLSKEEIIPYYQKVDASFGTLASFKMDMKEACPLKTRESLSYGKPIIYAYEDSDFSGNENWNLKLSPTDEIIDLEEIILFLEKVRGNENIEQEIEKYVKERIEWGVKLKKLVSFIANLK